jgi:hypothetical protein
MELIKKRTEFVKIINEMGLKRGVEVGVAKGEFSEYLLKNSNLEILYSIDAWSEDLKSMKAYRTAHDVNKVDEYYMDAKKRLSRFGNRSVMIKDISENAVKKFENESLDFIYLDASHLFTGFAIDLINWWEKLKWDGLFAGHDFIRKSTYQVSYAINGFCMERKQFYYLTTDDNGNQHNIPNPSWWLIKTKRNKQNWVKEFEQYKIDIRKQADELNKYLKADIIYECKNN